MCTPFETMTEIFIEQIPALLQLYKSVIKKHEHISVSFNHGAPCIWCQMFWELGPNQPLLHRSMSLFKLELSAILNQWTTLLMVRVTFCPTS